MSPVTTQLFTEPELIELLAREEGQFLEFKSLWDRDADPPRPLKRRRARDLVAESVAAFANADGGTLLLGVEDDGTPTGHAYPDDAITDLFAVPERRLRPPVRCRVQRIGVRGVEVLAVEVPLAPEAVMFEGNGFPYRVGDQVIREEQAVINDRKEAYRRVGYEQRVRPEARLDDIDLDLVRQFLGSSVLGKRQPEEILERYGLVVARNGGLAVTNACLLLFGKPPFARWHPRAGVRLFRVAGTKRQHGVERNVTQLARVDPPLATAIAEAHRVAREHIRRSERLHSLFFREMPEYPEFAWQEAIVNAFAHRDYEDQAREIEVWFYDDRMEVTSPGTLIPPVTLEALRERRPVHASRNPLIVRVLADVGIMREEGEGIPRMFEEMERSYLHAPQLREEAGQFAVVLRNEPMFTGPSPEWAAIVGQLPLSPAQRRVLLAHPEGFTNEDYRRLNSVDRDQAYREIQEMVSLGVVLSAEAPGRGAVYRVAPDLHETRAFMEARLPKIKTFLDQHLYVKNADYRALFGITRQEAVRELRRLVQDGYLRMEGERRGARYLPGPGLAQAGSK
jgi:ATP-dependent DNA helicase RecG